MPYAHVTLNVQRPVRDARSISRSSLTRQLERVSGAKIMDAEFKEGDHPRAANGQFGSGVVHEKMKTGTAAKAHFEKHGVTGNHEIHVVNRASGRYDGVTKIDDLVAKNGGNRAKTLTDLKWDHDQGRIQYKAPGGGAAAPAAAVSEKAPETGTPVAAENSKKIKPKASTSEAWKQLMSGEKSATEVGTSVFGEYAGGGKKESEKSAEPDHVERRRAEEHEHVKGVVHEIAGDWESSGAQTPEKSAHLRSKADAIAADIAGKPVSVNKLVDKHDISYGVANRIKEVVKENRMLKGWTNESRAPQTQSQRINSYLKQKWVKPR